MKVKGYIYTLFVLPFACVLNCGCDKEPVLTREAETVTYRPSKTNFCNPERGYYSQYTVRFSSGKMPKAISSSVISLNRRSCQTLTLSMFYLTDFMEGDISAAALDIIRQSFQAHRDAGMKTIVRFAYKDNNDEASKPYDPEVDIVLRHVAQLKPILQEYSDIILVLQAGFCGSWGEWAFTTHFNQSLSNSAAYEPRRKLIYALLDAMPKDRQVAVRTPMLKFGLFKTKLRDTITVETAYDGSDLSRIAGHNDCFISSGSDWGTYGSNKDRALWKAETAYTIMGGETCSGDATYCACSLSIEAMEAYHWTYQNRGYHSGTFKVWEAGQCMDEISMRLGYRFVLDKADFYSDFKAGTNLTVSMSIKNEGFAALANPRGLEFIIVDPETGEKSVYKSNIDPRRWAAGRVAEVTETLHLPSTLQTGHKYALYLNLPDARATLHDNPLYSIRLANMKLWEESTGYNKLCDFIAK